MRPAVVFLLSVDLNRSAVKSVVKVGRVGSGDQDPQEYARGTRWYPQTRPQRSPDVIRRSGVSACPRCPCVDAELTAELERIRAEAERLREQKRKSEGGQEAEEEDARRQKQSKRPKGQPKVKSKSGPPNHEQNDSWSRFHFAGGAEAVLASYTEEAVARRLRPDCRQKGTMPSPFLGACTAVGLHTRTLLVAAGGVAENAVRVSNPGKLRQTVDEQEIFDGFKVCTAPPLLVGSLFWQGATAV